MSYVRLEIEDAVGRIVMARPEKHNAFDETMIAELAGAIANAGRTPAIRVVLLTGEGPSFSAGADLDWMRRSAAQSFEENLADAHRFGEMLKAFNDVPKPTIAVVQGAAYGGGVGLTAAADIAIAAPDALFSLSEARLGLLPAVITPYVIRAVGERAARELALTARRFGAEEAQRLGLVTRVVPRKKLMSDVVALVRQLLEASPEAQAAIKRLFGRVAGRPIDEPLVRETAKVIAEARASSDGREGIAAFFEKRKPRWAAS